MKTCQMTKRQLFQSLQTEGGELPPFIKYCCVQAVTFLIIVFIGFISKSLNQSLNQPYVPGYFAYCFRDANGKDILSNMSSTFYVKENSNRRILAGNNMNNSPPSKNACEISTGRWNYEKSMKNNMASCLDFMGGDSREK